MIQLLGTSTFIFGLYLVFTLDNRKKRFETIREKLRIQDSKILRVYELSKQFDDKTKTEIKRRLEDFLMAQLDYTLQDIESSGTKLSELLNYVRNIKPKNSKQKDSLYPMIDTLLEIRDILKSVSHTVKMKMSSYEWFAFLLLFGITIFLVYQETNLVSIYSKIIISLLLSCFTFFVLIIRQLDTLNWQEQKWIWEPLITLFKELDLTPYIPEAVLSQRRLNLKDIKNLDSIRVGRFKHPYPDFSEKTIETIGIQKI